MGIFSFIKEKVVAISAKAHAEQLAQRERIIAEPLKELKTLAISSAIVVPSILVGAVVAPVVAPAVLKGAIGFVIRKPVVAIVGAGLLSTVGGRKLVTTAGKTLYSGAQEVGEIYGKEDKISIKEALVTGGLITAGLAGILAVPKIIEKVKGITTPILPLEKPEKQLIPEKEVGIEGEAPILPVTEELAPKKRLYKPRRAIKMPSVRQYVKVNVISKPRATGIRIQNKRYLNQALLN